MDLRRAAATIASTALAVALSTSCASPAPTERFRPDAGDSADAAPGADADPNRGLTYWSEGEESLELDACTPPAGSPPVAGALGETGAGAGATGEGGVTGEAGTPATAGLPAVVVVHGGGFTGGGRTDAGVRALCTDVAALGVAAFVVDYRLAPQHVWPDQVDDLARAVAWLREDAQVERFGLDPARVGVIGSSAGAILAQSLATRGEGPLDQGSRVAAAVSLSGVSDMGPDGLELGDPSAAAARTVLGYLGCPSVARCPQAVEASPITAVDPTDSPLLLVTGSDELVPAEQAEAMGEALRSAGVAERVVVRPGDRHGLGLLDDSVRRDVKTFLEEHL